MNSVFEKELQSAHKHFPQLKIHDGEGGHFLRGIIDIPNDKGEIAYSFLVEIHASLNYPQRYPILYEVGGDIPCCADWHKYNNNSCCVGVEAEEIIRCYNGISITEYITDIVIPYFANQVYKKQTGDYLQEYSHGTKGIKEFYEILMGTKNAVEWQQIIGSAFGKIKYQRNGKCYCGSGLKYKKCHAVIEDQIRMIGKNQIKKDFTQIGLL